jgi:hypothetical protein
MDHAEARELMTGHFAAPADAADGGADALRALAEMEAHLEGCLDCAAEYRALRATAAALQLVIGPPGGARQRVLDNVAQLGRQRAVDAARTIEAAAAAEPSRAESPVAAPSAGPRGWWPLALPRVLAVAAVVALLAFVAGAFSGALLPRSDDTTQLARAAMMMAELAREPTAHTMVLRDADGMPGGTVVYEPVSDRLVVFSEVLDEPASGRYGCYVERAGERTLIGPMLFEADAAFWAGPVSQSLDLGQPGDRFLVLRDASDATPMLAGTF